MQPCLLWPRINSKAGVFELYFFLMERGSKIDIHNLALNLNPIQGDYQFKICHAELEIIIMGKLQLLPTQNDISSAWSLERGACLQC